MPHRASPEAAGLAGRQNEWGKGRQEPTQGRAGEAG